MILPIDSLSEKALALYEGAGGGTETLYASVLLDLLPDGEGGECYLVLDSSRMGITRILPALDRIEFFPSADYKQWYTDSLLTRTRLLAVSREDEGVHMGYCTNACKSRLFVFLTVYERMIAGEPLLTERDSLFDGIVPKCPKCGEAYPDKNIPLCPHCDRKRGLIKRFLPAFLPYKRTFLIIALCLTVELLSDLIRPYLSGTILFDGIIAEGGRWHSERALILCLSSIIGLAVLRWLFILLRNVRNAGNVRLIGRDLKKQLFSSVQRMSLSYFNRNSTGRIMMSLGGDVDRLNEFLGYKLISLFIYAFEFIAVAILLFLSNWKMSLVVLLPIPLLVYIYKKLYPHLQRQNKKAYIENAKLSSKINDSLQGIRVVKSFSKEKEEAEAIDRRLDRLYRVNLVANLTSALLGPIVSLIIYLGHQSVWGIGGIYVMGEMMNYGEFCTYISYVTMIFVPIQFFSDFSLLWGQTSECAKRIADVLDAKPEVEERADAITPKVCLGRIEFRDVSFHYVQNRPILKRLSFTLESGDHVGLVGKTGSGKSTMANLITRMYDVTGGEILLDGVNIKNLSFAYLRRNVVIVSQEIHLFLGTIAENIKFGKPEADKTEIIEAAKAAGAHEFIMALPEGYETKVGISGRSLSGGERQRIAIARALLLRPQILILDEATAAMDNETERLIAEAIERLSFGCTTLSIAHRLSTLRDCNKIMAIEGGELREMGTKEELLAREGIFHKLYTLQNQQMMTVLTGEEEG